MKKVAATMQPDRLLLPPRHAPHPALHPSPGLLEAAARHESYTRAAQELSLTQARCRGKFWRWRIFGRGAVPAHPPRRGASRSLAHYYARQVGQRLQALERDTLDVMAHQGPRRRAGAGGGAHLCHALAHPAPAAAGPAAPGHRGAYRNAHPAFLFADTGFDAALYAGTPEQVARWPGTQAQWLMHEDVVPVCSPRLLEAAVQRDLERAYQPVAAQVLAQLPLLQQSTRPYGWRQWFDAMGVRAPRPGRPCATSCSP